MDGSLEIINYQYFYSGASESSLSKTGRKQTHKTGFIAMETIIYRRLYLPESLSLSCVTSAIRCIVLDVCRREPCKGRGVLSTKRDEALLYSAVKTQRWLP
jgi:hypothetical protein